MKVRIITIGPFKGCEGEVISEHGENLDVEVSIFSLTHRATFKKTEVQVVQGEDEEEGPWDPRPELRFKIRNGFDRWHASRMMSYWERLAEEPLSDPLVEEEAARIYSRKLATEWDAELRVILEDFEQEMSSVPFDEIQDHFEARQSRWMPHDEETKSFFSGLNTDVEREQRIQTRRSRCLRAVEDDRFAQWRASKGWSNHEKKKSMTAAFERLEGSRASFEARVASELGICIPEDFYRLWLFFEGLVPAEQEIMGKRLGFERTGLMRALDDPSHPLVDYASIRTPPEMIPYLRGPIDAETHGLWFDDGLNANGASAFFGNDGGDILVLETPLRHIRLVLEHREEQAERNRNQESLDELRLLREAIRRFETGDILDTGMTYTRSHYLWVGRMPHLGTLDGAGAIVDGETIFPRGIADFDHHAARELHQIIRTDSDRVERWGAEAQGRLRQGDAAEALCLGRDLWWKCVHDDLAVTLLGAAYETLNRPALVARVRALANLRAGLRK